MTGYYYTTSTGEKYWVQFGTHTGDTQTFNL